MKKLIVIDIVGLSKKELDKTKPPNILQILGNGFQAVLKPSFPAVTCSVQASITSGFFPSEHGIVANGYYDKNLYQVSFWEQSASLVEKPRIWDILKKSNPRIKTAVLFWQNSLFINSDIVVTPKPMHLDSGMVMWCYSKPTDFYDKLSEKLGSFDLTWYWGPFVSLKSSQWIINAAKYTIQSEKPDILFVYLPHLDYAAQKHGPESQQYRESIVELDDLIGEFLMFLDSEFKNEYEIMLLSEYNFNSVKYSISPNQILKKEGLLNTRKISGKEYLDFEFSNAFAMADHQIAHVFTKSGYEEQVSEIFQKTNGVSKIINKESQKTFKIQHSRSGDLILCANDDAWFNYYWWEDSNIAPEFAFNVDIHRKPGYDPLELFLDPQTKKISHDTSLIKGSHGIINTINKDNLPIFGTTLNCRSKDDVIKSTQIGSTIVDFFNIKNQFPNNSIL